MMADYRLTIIYEQASNNIANFGHINKTDEKDSYYSRPSAAGTRMPSLQGRIYGAS